MLNFPANVRLLLANRAIDGRKFCNGFAAVVSSEFGASPTSGDMFIFLDRRPPPSTTAQAQATLSEDVPSRDRRDVRPEPQDGEALVPGAHIYRRAGASLLAHLLKAKCDDALPIYQQRQQLACAGFDVAVNTL